MFEFQKMSQADFEVYLKTAVDHLAAELIRAKEITQEAAREAALNSFNSLFPERLVNSKDQFVYHMVSAGERVGVVHFGVKRDKKVPYIYLWDIVVSPEHRGKGFGRKAMQVLEDHAKLLGFSTIRLNVFGHNPNAAKLYETQGYLAESIAMVKKI